MGERMRKLLIYLKGYRLESVLAPVFKLLEAAMELTVPLIVASMIDRGIADSDSPHVVKMSLLLVAFGAVGLFFTLIAQYFAAKASVGFASRLKHALFAHIQTFSYKELDDVGTSTLVTRMTSDMNQVQTGLNLTLRLLLRSPFIVFGAMLMALTIDLPTALVFVFIIPFLFLAVFAVMLACIPLYKKVQGILDRVVSRVRQNIRGVRVIRAFGREKEELTGFCGENGELTGMQKRVGRISALLNPLTYVLINLAVILLIRQGALRVDSGAMTQGQVVAMYNYMSQILIELIKFANLIINMTKSVACAKRIGDALDIKGSEEEVLQEQAYEHVADPSQGASIEFRHVSFRYHEGSADALSDLTFTLDPGETVGIIGGTGAGKSTLVNLIPRFYEPTEGQVLIDGADVADLPLSHLRGKIGIVPQKAILFSGTLADQVRFGKSDATDEEIIEAMKSAQAADVSAAREEGLSAEVSYGGSNFSGGQRQRLTIARALVRKPSILIFDDSSSALDFATDARLRKEIKSMQGNATVLLVSQRTSSIRHADKIIVLEDGRAVGIGTHESLLESCEVYREIHHSQFEEGGDDK